MTRFFYIVAFAACAAALFGCGRRTYVPSAEENRTIEYEIGVPNFDLEAVATVGEDGAGVGVYLAIPPASLVFVRDGERFAAAFDVLVRVREGGELVRQAERSDSLSVADYASTQQFEPISLHERIALPAGAYTVEVAVEDLESGERALRRQEVEVPDPAASAPAVSGLLLEAVRGAGAFEAVPSVHLPAGYDSLRIVAELYHVPEQAVATLQLVRFETDTTAASPPYWFMPPPFSLEYMGVDYGEADTVQVSSRIIANASDRFEIEFALPPLEEGTYMSMLKVSDGDVLAERRRYWTVKDPSFPRITTLHELVEALRYIARDDEMAHILEASTSHEMKDRFDAFWADRVPNKQAAASLLERYYSRVEQANILFSAHKEGWKTDRGMIYVVFGPPGYVEEYPPLRKEWYYFERGAILNRRLPPFVFRRAMTYGMAGLFDIYVLQRTEAYEEEWRRKVEDWRDGTVL